MKKFDVILVKCFLVFAYISSTGAFIDLIRDGGARQQGIDNNVRSSALWEQFPKIWLFLNLLYLAYHFIFRRKMRIAADLWFLLFFFFMASSVFWSKYVGVALFLSLQLTACFFLVVASLKLIGPKAYLNLFSNYGAVVLFFCTIACLFFPSYGISVNLDSEGAWQGVFFHKNIFGGFSLLCFYAYVIQLSINFSWKYFLLAIFSSGLIFLSESSSSIACLILLATYNFGAYIFRVKGYKFLSWILVLTVFLGICFLVYVSFSKDLIKIPIFDKDTSFSGRVYIWAFIIQKIIESPFLGYGIGQLAVENNRDGSEFANAVGQLVSSAHNGFLDLAYALGAVGIIIFIIIIYKYIKYINNFHSRAAGSFLLIYLSINLFEARLVSFNIFFIFFIYIYMSGKMSRKI